VNDDDNTYTTTWPDGGFNGDPSTWGEISSSDNWGQGTAVEEVNFYSRQERGRVILSWRDEGVEGLGYLIKRKEKKEYKNIALLKGNIYEDRNVKVGKTYHYKLYKLTFTGILFCAYLKVKVLPTNSKRKNPPFYYDKTGRKIFSPKKMGVYFRERRKIIFLK